MALSILGTSLTNLIGEGCGFKVKSALHEIYSRLLRAGLFIKDDSYLKAMLSTCFEIPL